MSFGHDAPLFRRAKCASAEFAKRFSQYFIERWRRASLELHEQDSTRWHTRIEDGERTRAV